MKREPSRVPRFILGAASALGALFLSVTAAYFLTGIVYRLLHVHPHGYVSQLITSLLGYLIAMVMVFVVVGRYAHSRQHAFISALFAAMRQIAKGDFNITLDKPDKIDPRFGQFVDHMNWMAQELKQLELLRQEFVSNVSHEIQSPLTSINGFAQALQSDSLSSEERRHYLSIIETESKRLSRLSDSLLKLASLDAERFPFEPQRYRLDAQLRRTILAAEPQWLEKSLDIQLELPETYVAADEELMSQVWVNLFHNSVKFTPRHGVISVRIAQGADSTEVCFTDTGPGIAREEQERIFERFYKVDKSRNRDAGGSGLGLSIAKKIVDMHEGRVELTSEPGQGARFCVSLPGGRSAVGL